MEIVPLALKGAYEIKLRPIGDERGYFVTTYLHDAFQKNGLVTGWVQENQSRSSKGVVRGMHFQTPPASETKLVRAVRGSIWDVFVDLRKDSPTFGRWQGVEVSEEKQNMVYIPKGFAHGFCVLSDIAVVTYKVDHVYAPGAQGGLRWNDPTIGIPWPVKEGEAVVSQKDREAPLFEGWASPF
jgi:dTDP-4-dehydrorhamnose 3,5-epimerase